MYSQRSPLWSQCLPPILLRSTSSAHNSGETHLRLQVFPGSVSLRFCLVQLGDNDPPPSALQSHLQLSSCQTDMGDADKTSLPIY